MCEAQQTARYIKRHAEQALARMSKSFGAVLVTGARQTGKTTLLRQGNFTDQTYRYVSLDDPIKLQAALNSGGEFFLENKPPVIIDEIQYAPPLFSYIKMIIDDEQTPGAFLLSGSQQFHLMKNVGESLAGRLAVLSLCGLSQREIKGVNFYEPFLPEAGYYEGRRKKNTNLDYDEIWRIIHRGSMPRLYRDKEIDWEDFWNSFTRTYLERDVRDLAQVGNEQRFLAFMTSVAARTGAMLNLSSIAQETGISVPTVERWLSILVASNLIFLLRPFHVNVSKRMVHTPKLYFLDTGLAAWLTQWPSAEVLRNGHMGGAFFETFVIIEILKSYANQGREAPLYYYRDRDGREIDLLIWQKGKLYPIEIKKHANPGIDDIKHFSALASIANIERGSGGVICMYKELASLTAMDKIIPLSWL
ncbi:MAG: ATP-binding protein [Spirochaetales bacterium]|nr:ATP-binding protein [Spirochaetales bacterium]